MRREFGAFLDEVDAVDLTVEEGGLASPDRMLSVDFSFDDSSFVVETPFGRIQLEEGLLRAEPGGSFELLRWVKYVMRKRVMKREATVLHAAALAHEGVGYLFPAWGHTGKTNVTLSFLANGYDYMSDDWSFITGAGEILAYPRHLALFDYNFECHPFLIAALAKGREGPRLRRRLAATRFARSMNGSSWLFRMFSRWLSDRYFVEVRVPVSRVIPGCKTVLRSRLSKVFLLTTARSGVGDVSEVPADQLARKVALFSHYERSRFFGHELALAYAGLQEVEEDLLSVETSLLQEAFKGARCLEVTIPPIVKSEDADRTRRVLEKA